MRAFPAAHFKALLLRHCSSQSVASAVRVGKRSWKSRNVEASFVDAIKAKDVRIASERLASLGRHSTVKHHSMLVKLLANKGRLDDARRASASGRCAALHC